LGRVNKLGLVTNTQILLWGVKLLFKTFFFLGGGGGPGNNWKEWLFQTFDIAKSNHGLGFSLPGALSLYQVKAQRYKIPYILSRLLLTYVLGFFGY
jgi:hypothetical protein